MQARRTFCDYARIIIHRQWLRNKRFPNKSVDSVNTQTGVVVLDADDISDAATTKKFTTSAQISKLAAIKPLATADQSDAEIVTAISGSNPILGDLKIDTQLTQGGTAARAFIDTSSSSGGAKFKVYKNTNTTDGYARFKLDRAYDYGNSDQMVQEAIYQRRTTTKSTYQYHSI